MNAFPSVPLNNRIAPIYKLYKYQKAGTDNYFSKVVSCVFEKFATDFIVSRSNAEIKGLRKRQTNHLQKIPSFME